MAIKHIKHLITNLLTGSSSMSERAELARWMNSEEAEHDSKEAWKSASKDIENSLKNEMWDNIRSKIKNIIPESVPAKRIKYKTYSIPKVAAFIAIILCSTLTAYLLYNNMIGQEKGIEGDIYTFEVERGQKGSMRLADGTVVYLNSASKISYAGNYNSKNRVVNLDGEAYFKVAKNPNKKFIVTCNGVDIEALGTEFNVKAYPNDSIITTTLATGKVKVSSNEQSVTLLPKDVATYNLKHQTIQSSTVNDISIADYWRTGQLVFDAEPLSSIAQNIERMYNVKVYIEDTKLRKMKFTGTIQNNSLNNVLHIMSLSYPLTYTVTDSIITVSAKNSKIKNTKSKKN